MNFELFKKMVDEAGELGVPELCPNGYGELLVLKNVEEYLSYISGHKHKFHVLINTNGHMMTDDKIEMFFKHQVRWLNIMIDGATAETAQTVRVGLSTERIEDNIHRLLARRRELGLTYPKIRTGMVVIPQNAHEHDAFIKKWTGVVDQVAFGGFSNRAASIAGAKQIGPPATSCVLPFKELNIWADGKAVVCCDDWNEEHVVGDLNTQSIAEIWHGEAFRKVREHHLRGEGGKLAICAKCNYWRQPTSGARLWS